MMMESSLADNLLYLVPETDTMSAGSPLAGEMVNILSQKLGNRNWNKKELPKFLGYQRVNGEKLQLERERERAIRHTIGAILAEEINAEVNE